ncbi:MAG: PD40 domain-containing protein, partial [Anaerolineae bacterium]|nr:PD40 domain-containing protein [Anaerolineae bacterium]
HPAWSPDGKQIAFAVEDETGLIQIYVVDLDTCSTSNECTSTQLTNDSWGQSFEPAWSPDGQKIAFSSERDGFYAIYTMNADGTNQRRLTENKPLGDNDPTWSPDGDHIAFIRWIAEASDRGISKRLYVMTSDGIDLQCVIGNGASDPDWWLELDEVPDEPIELLATEASS